VLYRGQVIPISGAVLVHARVLPSTESGRLDDGLSVCRYRRSPSVSSSPRWRWSTTPWRSNRRYAQVEQAKRFVILDHDLSQEAGELTPTLKVKRDVVNRRYAAEFDALYR